MKKIFLIIVMVLSICCAFAQEWGPWMTVYKSGEENDPNSLVVQISYKPGNCPRTWRGGYRIRSTKKIPKCTLKFRHDYTDCFGKKITGSIWVNLEKDPVGDGFFGTMTKPFYDVRLECLNSNNTPQLKPSTNELVFPKSEKAKYFDFKRDLQAKINTLRKVYKYDFNYKLKKIAGKDAELSSKEYLTRRRKLEQLEKEVNKKLPKPVRR